MLKHALRSGLAAPVLSINRRLHFDCQGITLTVKINANAITAVQTVNLKYYVYN